MEVDGKAITRENKLQQWARWGTRGGDAGDGEERRGLPSSPSTLPPASPPHPPLPCSSLVAKFQSSQQRASELATLAEEGPAMRGEVARLRMELGLVAQAQREREQHVVVRGSGLGRG